MPWRPRTILPLHRPPARLDGRDAPMPVKVKTWLFRELRDLDCDEQWQAAPLTQHARARLVARPFQAWKVWYPRWDRQVATVIQFLQPLQSWEAAQLMVSAAPQQVMMGEFDRIMLLQEGGIIQVDGRSTPGYLFRMLADTLAKDIATARRSVPAEDFHLNTDNLGSLEQ